MAARQPFALPLGWDVPQETPWSRRTNEAPKDVSDIFQAALDLGCRPALIEAAAEGMSHILRLQDRDGGGDEDGAREMDLAEEDLHS